MEKVTEGNMDIRKIVVLEDTFLKNGRGQMYGC